MTKYKKIIYYAISNSHIRNVDILYERIFKKNNYKISLFFEKKLNLIEYKNLNKEYEIIDIDKIDLNSVDRSYALAIFSTAQARRKSYELNIFC